MATAAAATSRAVAEADHGQESGATHAAAAAKRLHAKVKGKTKHRRGKHDRHHRGHGHAHDPAHPLGGPERSALFARTGIQPALLISQPGDAAEAEADRVADRVVAMKDPPAAPARARGGDLQRSPLVVQRAAARAAAPPTPQPAAENVADAATEAAVKAELSGGAPMAADVAGFFGRRFGANFGDVRVHTDDKAANLATRLGARAFTYGRHVFFNGGQYNPDSEDGTKLIAHELAHTIQQSAVIQLKEDAASPPRVTSRSAPQAQRGIVSRALNWIADKANYIPGFRLFTIVIGVNPINMSTVERSGANILRALIEFIPGGGLIVDALNNHGIFEKGGKFIEDQFHSLGMVGSAFRDALMEFIDSLSWSDVFHLGDVWDRAKRIFTAPVDKLISFGKGLVVGIAEIVRDAILKPLGRYAAGIIPKFDLLAGVFGKNPVSGESVSPANALIGGFMTLIGQEEIWANIQKSGAVGKAWNWFKGALSGALALVKTIPDRFISTLKSLTIFDIVTIVGAWVKFGKLFLGFVADFTGWALKQVLKLLEIILEVVAPSVIPYLKKAGAAFNTIIKAPGRFIGFLVKAGKAGFNMFKTNILAHLQRGILDWLLGSLAGANLYIPKSFALLELLKFGLSVVGATWENVRAKLVAATNETTVKVFETTFDLVKTLVTQGPAAAWEQLLETLSNLKSMVMDAIIDYVKGKVIEIAIEKVLSFLNPAGAFIQAVLAIYRTITFIVGKLQQIGAVVAALIDGIAAIAAGNIGPASAKVESVLARGLSLAINFLANFAGLGNVSKKIIEIINKIRKPVDNALDKLVTWIVNKAKALGKSILQAGVPADPNARLKLAIRDASLIAKGLGKRISRDNLDRALGAVRTRYGLTALQVSERNGVWSATASINPTLTAQIATTPAGTPGAPLPVRTPPLPASTTVISVRPSFRKGRNLQGEQVEYDRQVGMQQGGINAMSVSEWQRNRASYIARRTAPGSRSGRDPASAVDQAQLRVQVLDEMTRRLQMPLLTPTTFPALGMYEHGAVTTIFGGGSPAERAAGFSAGRAAGLAAAWMRTQHALHSPDQVAGGSRLNAAGGVSPDRGLTGMGLANVNMSLGAQWKDRIANLDSDLNTFLNSGVPGGPVTLDAEKQKIRMNVSLLPVV